MTPEQALERCWKHICAIAKRDGIGPINQYPGLWMLTAGRWQLKINGHAETIGHVLPYHALIEYNGWPAGMIHPYAASIAAGAAANIFTLEAALREAAAQ